jgi:hypothetical protein
MTAPADRSAARSEPVILAEIVTLEARKKDQDTSRILPPLGKGRAAGKAERLETLR